MTPLPLINAPGFLPAQKTPQTQEDADHEGSDFLAVFDEKEAPVPPPSADSDGAVAEPFFVADDSVIDLTAAENPTVKDNAGQQAKADTTLQSLTASSRLTDVEGVPTAAGMKSDRSVASEKPKQEGLTTGRKAKSHVATIAQTMVEGKMPHAVRSPMPEGAAAKINPAPQIAGGEALDQLVGKGADLLETTKDTVPPVTDKSRNAPVPTQAITPAAKMHGLPTAQDTLRAEPADRPSRDQSPEVRAASSKVKAPGAVATAPQPVLPPIMMSDGQKVQSNASGTETEVLTALGASERSVTATAPSAASPTTAAGAETARHVAHQLSVAVTQHQGRLTEIALNPEELGRVRLSMTAMDATITLNVHADRPETADLLRRHIDALAQEFRALGYDNISFSFSGDGQTEGRDDPKPGPVTIEDMGAQEPHTQTAARAVSGLDLRL